LYQLIVADVFIQHHVPGSLKAKFTVGFELFFIKELVAGRFVGELRVGPFVTIEIGM